MLTLAMPQSEPAADMNCSASRTSVVKMDGRQALRHVVVQRNGLRQLVVLQHVEDGRKGLVAHHLGLRGHLAPAPART